MCNSNLKEPEMELQSSAGVGCTAGRWCTNPRHGNLMRRGLETKSRATLHEHKGRNLGHGQGTFYGPPR
jgi:hypothetical protein